MSGISDDEVENEATDQTPLEKTFNAAVNHLPQLMNKIAIHQDDLLYLYARFKQSTQGPCCAKRPGFLEFQAKKKWDSWNSIKSMSKEEAQSQYVGKIKELDASWEPQISDSKQRSAAGGVKVSAMADTGEQVSEADKNAYDWCKEGNLSKLKSTLQRTSVDINATDDMGLSMLHWASDRGNVSVVEYLIGLGANINCTDNDGQTPLHYACSCEHEEIVQVLLKNSADLNCKDSEGETPIQLTNCETIRKLLTS